MDDYNEWKEKWELLVDKYYAQGITSLSNDEKVWLCIRMLIDSSNNGGLISFYQNDGADNLNETFNSLNVINSKSVIISMKKLHFLFPFGIVPQSNGFRKFLINLWPDFDWIDTKLTSIDEELFPLLEKAEENLHRYLKKRELI